MLTLMESVKGEADDKRGRRREARVESFRHRPTLSCIHIANCDALLTRPRYGTSHVMATP